MLILIIYIFFLFQSSWPFKVKKTESESMIPSRINSNNIQNENLDQQDTSELIQEVNIFN